MSFEAHSNALQSELNSLNHLIHTEKEKLERTKQDQKNQQVQMSAVLENYQSNQQEFFKQQKIISKYDQMMAQYVSQLPQEAQMQLTSEYEKVKQALAAPTADPHQQLTQNMMAGNMMGGMPLPAMMALQAQAQAQLGRGMMPGMPAPSPRVQKANGMPNGIPGMPPNMANGLSQMAAMQNPMLAAAAAGMPQMAQLQAMAAFSSMQQAMGAMQGFNPAQLAAMQSMGMSSMGMLPPMSTANHAAALGMMNPMGLSVSTPSRNPSNGGPLSGARTPQSAPSNGVNSPRPAVKEEPAEVKKEEVVRGSPTEDSVAVA